MAIVKPTAPTLTPVVVGTTMLTIGSTGSPVAMPATTNRKKMKGGSKQRASTSSAGPTSDSSAVSTGFQQLDGLIIQLDGIFDDLPLV